MIRKLCILVAALACSAGLGGFVASAAAASSPPTAGPTSGRALAAQRQPDACRHGRSASHVRARGLHARGHWRGGAPAVVASWHLSAPALGRATHLDPAGSGPALRTRHHNTRAPPTKEGRS